MHEEKETYPEGHFVGMWMGIGMALFSALGIPLSIATGNPGLIGIGPALGVAVGLAIGQSIENNYKQQGKIRPLNESEKKRKKSTSLLGILLLIVGVILAVTLFLFLV